MRLFLAVLLAVTVLPTLSVADGKSCLRHFQGAPQAFSGLTRINSYNYEEKNPGFGYSVGYRNDVMKFTVYYFDLSQPRISDTLLMQAFKQSAREMKQVIQRQGRRVKEMQAIEITPARYGVRALARAITSKGYSEYVGLSKRSNCLIKYRYTIQAIDQTIDDSFWHLTALYNLAHFGK